MTPQNTALSLLRSNYKRLKTWRKVSEACGKAESQVVGWIGGAKMSDTTAEIIILRLSKK